MWPPCSYLRQRALCYFIFFSVCQYLSNNTIDIYRSYIFIVFGSSYTKYTVTNMTNPVYSDLRWTCYWNTKTDPHMIVCFQKGNQHICRKRKSIKETTFFFSAKWFWAPLNHLLGNLNRKHDQYFRHNIRRTYYISNFTKYS